MILATKDAASLSWLTVRGAWAVSMHVVEEGRLEWEEEDINQWSFNRLGASQVALSNRQTTSQATREIFRYYNEGSCSHESHHGSYSRLCSFCVKYGRNLAHPESKCNFKLLTLGGSVNQRVISSKQHYRIISHVVEISRTVIFI